MPLSCLHCSQLQGPVLPPQCFLRGDKNLFQNVPSRGLRLPCWGPAEEVAPRSPEAGAELGGSSALILSALLHVGILFPNAAGSFAPEKKSVCSCEGGHKPARAARGGGSDSTLEAFKTPGQPALGGPA